MEISKVELDLKDETFIEAEQEKTKQAMEWLLSEEASFSKEL